MGLLAVGAGAAAGTQQMLENMLKERAAKLLESRLAEETRHNQADESLRGRGIDVQGQELAARARNEADLNNFRILQLQGTQANQQANILNQLRDDARQRETLRPVGSPVTGQTYDELSRLNVVPMESYKQTGETAGFLTGDSQGPTLDKTYQFTGFRPKDETPPSMQLNDQLTVGGKHQPLVFNPKGKPGEQFTDPSGNPVDTSAIGSYERPAAPDRVLVQVADPNSPTGASLVPRAQAAGKGAPPTSSTRTMMEGAQMLQPHIDSIREQANELDKAGLFGPMMSRIRQLAEHAGTLDELTSAIDSDPQLNQDRRIGRFAASLGLLATASGRVHGGARGGGSPQMLQHFKSLLSDSGTNEMFQGRIDALDEYMGGYAKGPQGSNTGGTGTVPPSGKSQKIGRFTVTVE